MSNTIGIAPTPPSPFTGVGLSEVNIETDDYDVAKVRAPSPFMLLGDGENINEVGSISPYHYRNLSFLD